MDSGKTGPLSGVRVLDLTQFLSGPFGTQILGDLGAEIVKIEPPGGELARGVPPHFVEGDSAYYLAVNRNKKSVVIDLKTDKGAELVRELAAHFDVLVENNRPGVMERLGLGEAELRARNPRLVYCSISGFGQTGPDRDLPAYDMIVQAMSGGMSLTGEPGRAPVRAGIPIGDLAAGMYGVMGILAALFERQTSGEGRFVDVSMLDAQIAMLCYQGAYYLMSGEVPEPQGRGHDSIPTYRAFECGDGVSLVVTANTERMWADLCKAIDLPHLVHDPRFKDSATRLVNKVALWEILEARFRDEPAQSWLDSLSSASIPAALVKTVDKALNASQVAHRDMIVELRSRAGSHVRVPGNPIKFDDPGRTDVSYPPHLGEHTSIVLREYIGLDAEALRTLQNQGVVRQFVPGMPSPGVKSR
ncbi:MULTISPECIES: CaiB/BaiF CoA transferase family protein [Paraburkholderia]|uniref:CaiB/BaiF CoA transferase family protein n=1 Tax=Paraburkholderia TaxID=1822464 RepID=UPI0015922BB8|nr:CoA transferase [Paraburkholderia youngii]NUX56576.1 CoA transferase [Paraburkholderia youngii]